MFNIFKCKHPAQALHVKKMHTSVPNEKDPELFNDVTYHLYCRKCNKDIDIKFAETTGMFWDFS